LGGNCDEGVGGRAFLKSDSKGRRKASGFYCSQGFWIFELSTGFCRKSIGGTIFGILADYYSESSVD